ncbi:MAG TPA: protein kinase [Thermoanaerobaculia bacterium]|nr:protein kinase [Thermoanaerobaculia bacterium]
MTLVPGSRLGPYEITAPLGEGGMGVVYRATDPKLKREVAIKVLPAAFAEDAERLARFEREAQVLAQLQHPNIASIYGLEESNGVRALVMELVEGEDLAERLKRGPFPLDEALAIARQIAEALEAAHEKGIVHRDLKPANVKLTPEGKVKVLDFGLAKAMDPPGGAASAADLARSPTMMNSPTMTATHGTQLGVILGTAAYMAPEQARGAVVDKRADIWALGVVLHEMLTGRSLFSADTVSDTLAGVLRGEIDLAKLPAGTPPALRRLLRRCLERNPKNRLHDAADARLVLADLEAGVADETPVAPTTPVRGNRREMAAWGVAAAAMLAAGALFLGRPADEPSAPRVIRATLPLPAGVSIELDGERAGMPAVSPDGRRVAFGAREGAGPMRIWVHDLGTAVARPLPGTEEGYRPFWSPDGRRIGFFTWSHVATTPSEGGAVARLAPARDARGGTWSPNGTILFAPFATGPLLAISDRGGPTREVSGTREALGSGTHRFPQFLPDGEHFVYLDRSGRLGVGGRAGVMLGRLGAAAPVRRLLDHATNATWADGRLLYVRDGALVAQPLDPKRLVLSGEPKVLVEDLLFNRRFAYGVFSASEAGVLTFLTGKQRDLCRLVWRDRSGRRLGELGTPGNLSGFGGLALSRDGRWAAVGRVDEVQSDADIWLYDVVRGTETRLARQGSDESDPIFAHDGSALYFGSAGDAGAALVRRDLASGAETTLFAPKGSYNLGPMSLSPDGTGITCDDRNRQAYSDVVLRQVDGKGEAKTLVGTPGDDSYGQISPDGRWLLWASDDSGRYEVYVAPFPGGGSRVQISREGGIQPRWNPAGGEILFKTPENVLTAVRIETGSGTVSVGTPTPLFPIVEFVGWTYDVSADGTRFLVREPLVEGDASPITLLTDWTSLLEPR